MPLLSEERRKKLREKAQKRASKQLRKTTGQANRQISRIESGANRRSAGVRRSYSRASEQIGNVSTAGLKGRYANEVEREIAASQAGLARVAPHHVSKVQARAAGRVRDIRSGLREAKQSAVDTNLSALVEAARGRVAEKQEVTAANQQGRAVLSELVSKIPPSQYGVLHLGATREELAKDVAGMSPDLTEDEARILVEKFYRNKIMPTVPGVLSDRERAQVGNPRVSSGNPQEMSDEKRELYQRLAEIIAEG